MTNSMTWAEVRAFRMWRHHLSAPASDATPADIAAAVCGIHAQMMPAAELSIGIRMAGSTRRDVRAALWDERSLVKTYGIRGTIHLFPARDLAFWMAASRARAEAVDIKRLRQVGLDSTRLARISDAIAHALDGQHLTLKQLEGEVLRRAGTWTVEETTPAFGGAWPVWRMALGWAAAQGALCFGPNDGVESTFVRPDQWLGANWDAERWRGRDREQAALGEACRGYLQAYGPATARDFAQWFNIPVPLARTAVSVLGDELVEVDVEGSRALVVAAALPESYESAPGLVHLLPHFDCYLRGFHPREQLVGPWAQRAGGGTGNVPVLLVNGMVGGVWQRKERRGRVAISVEPFIELTREHRDQVEVEAARLGAFLELSADLTFGSVDVRPHM